MIPVIRRRIQTEAPCIQAKEEYDPAITDANEAIRLDSNLRRSIRQPQRGVLKRGGHDRALGDANEAIRLAQLRVSAS